MHTDFSSWVDLPAASCESPYRSTHQKRTAKETKRGMKHNRHCCLTHQCNTGINSAMMLSAEWKFFCSLFPQRHTGTSCSPACALAAPAAAASAAAALAAAGATGLLGSAAHYTHFLLLPLTPHSSHLTVLPFAPFIAPQCLQYCPQSLK